jgi:hypothetical protein
VRGGHPVLVRVPAVKISRGAVAILLSLVGTSALWSVQLFVTSPGEITFTEFRLSLLLGGPSIIVTLTAYWVDAGKGQVDRRTDRDA